jgi:hypothetical protein
MKTRLAMVCLVPAVRASRTDPMSALATIEDKCSDDRLRMLWLLAVPPDCWATSHDPRVRIVSVRDLHDHRRRHRPAHPVGDLRGSMEKWTAASDSGVVPGAGEGLPTVRASREPSRACLGEQTLSITQMEYRETLRRIDVLVFMANEEADWPAAATAGLRAEPETVRWRAELQEHKVVGFFTSRPESIDVDAALARWLQSRAESQAKGEPGAASDGTAAIDIRAYSNSEGVLIVWRSAQPIERCLGFALYRRVLGNAGISDEVVTSTLGFRQAAGAVPGERVPTTRQPIQRFRWFDREQRRCGIAWCQSRARGRPDGRGEQGKQLDRMGHAAHRP